jgi:hypothetical protein
MTSPKLAINENMIRHDVPCIGDKSEDMATTPKFEEIKRNNRMRSAIPNMINSAFALTWLLLAYLHSCTEV